MHVDDRKLRMNDFQSILAAHNYLQTCMLNENEQPEMKMNNLKEQAEPEISTTSVTSLLERPLTHCTE